MIKYGEIAVAQSIPFRIGHIETASCAITCLRLGVVALVVFGGMVLRAEESAFQCIDRLALPVYGGLVWQAQLTGTATARILLNSEGTAIGASVDSPHAALTGWVKGWLSKASFRKECGGQTLQLIFNYRLEGEKRESPDNHVLMKHPGTVEITASPPILHPTIN